MAPGGRFSATPESISNEGECLEETKDRSLFVELPNLKPSQCINMVIPHLSKATQELQKYAPWKLVSTIELNSATTEKEWINSKMTNWLNRDKKSIKNSTTSSQSVAYRLLLRDNDPSYNSLYPTELLANSWLEYKKFHRSSTAQLKRETQRMLNKIMLSDSEEDSNAEVNEEEEESDASIEDYNISNNMDWEDGSDNCESEGNDALAMVALLHPLSPFYYFMTMPAVIFFIVIPIQFVVFCCLMITLNIFGLTILHSTTLAIIRALGIWCPENSCNCLQVIKSLTPAIIQLSNEAYIVDKTTFSNMYKYQPNSSLVDKNNFELILDITGYPAAMTLAKLMPIYNQSIVKASQLVSCLKIDLEGIELKERTEISLKGYIEK